VTEQTEQTEQARATALTVGQVAGRFQITVRTLHHYDEIGLLTPGERTGAGYRLYTAADITRLQHIVVYRRLGFALEEIALLLAHPDSVRQHLRRQRAAVANRLEEMRELVAAIDTALEKESTGMKLTRKEQQELFGNGYSDEYAAEAEQRWGDTEAWAQSRRRTGEYTKQDWIAIKAAAEAVDGAFIAAKRAGLAADSPAAMDAAEQHRQHIHDRFYELTHEFHRNLADSYIADERFTRYYDDQEPGLAQYVRDAVHANADRHVR
jgi:MerR family transcriptional regulator, thiopeptide resistance regulator